MKWPQYGGCKSLSVILMLFTLFQQSRSIINIKIYSELLVSNIGRVNHLAMSRLNLKFKIFSELLVGNIGGRGGPVILPCPG